MKYKLYAVLGAFTIYSLDFYSKHASSSPNDPELAGPVLSISPLSKKVETLG